MRTATSPPLSQEPSWDAVDRRRPPSQFRTDGPHHANQFNGDSRHEAGEPRHRRPLHVEEMDRISSHSTPANRGSMSIDTRLAHQSDERFIDDTHRTRPALSPSTLRRQASFAGHEAFTDVHRHTYPDDRELFIERQTQSWDREQELQREQYSPVLARSAHPDRAGMFEANPQSFAGPSHDLSVQRSSKPVRIRRPGPQSLQSHPDDFPMRPEAPPDRWPSNGDRGEERSRDEPAPRTHSHHQRPAPSRRGGSLLDRLSLDNTSSMSSPSLRERVQIIPSKRDRDEMAGNNAAGGDVDLDDAGQDDLASKKPRRRLKAKRGRRSGAQ